MAMSTPFDDARAALVRKRLKRTRAQRDHQLASHDALADAIKLEVKSAQEVGIPMAEVARLLGIDRSTLYRVYVNADE